MSKLTSNNYHNLFRLHLIHLHINHKYSLSDLSNLFFVSRSSIYNWKKLFTKNKLHEKQKYIKITSYIRNDTIKNFISKYINNNCNFNYKILIKEIFTLFSITIKKSTLYNIIKTLKFTKKRVKTKKIYGSKDKLIEKKKELQNKVKNINLDNIISIDEVSFDTNIIHNYAWSIKNIPVIKTIGATYKRVTMLCAISNKKIIQYKIVNNSADKNIFLDFLKIIPNKDNKILFLDNARIHHAKIIKNYVTNNNIKLLFNTPYSPEFNPIEIMFSKLKKLVKDCNINNNLNILKINIINSLNYITKNDLNNFFNRSFNILLNSIF